MTRRSRGLATLAAVLLMVSACGDEPVEVPAGGSAAPITKEDRFSGDEGLAAFRQAADAACTPIRQSLSPTPPSGDASAIRPWAAAQRRGLTSSARRSMCSRSSARRAQRGWPDCERCRSGRRHARWRGGHRTASRGSAAADLAAMRDAAFSRGCRAAPSSRRPPAAERGRASPRPVREHLGRTMRLAETSPTRQGSGGRVLV